mgnify:CR=1 FL=1
MCTRARRVARCCSPVALRCPVILCGAIQIRSRLDVSLDGLLRIKEEARKAREWSAREHARLRAERMRQPTLVDRLRARRFGRDVLVLKLQSALEPASRHAAALDGAGDDDDVAPLVRRDEAVPRRPPPGSVELETPWM